MVASTFFFKKSHKQTRSVQIADICAIQKITRNLLLALFRDSSVPPPFSVGVSLFGCVYLCTSQLPNLT